MLRKEWIIWTAVVSLLLGWAVIQWATRVRPGSSQTVGHNAPSFSLRNLDGTEEVHSKDLRGQAVLVDFWATWCGPCREIMPILEEVYRTCAPKGLMLLSVNTEGTEPVRIRSFLLRNGLSFPVYLDDGRMSMQYQVASIPHLVLIDKQGIIRHVYTGGVSSRALRRDLLTRIEQLLIE